MKYIRLEHALPCVVIATWSYYRKEQPSTRRYVPIHLIRNTQLFISIKGFQHYMQRPTYTDSAGYVIWGSRFIDSPNVYLMNGHHRATALKCLGKQKLFIEIVDFPYTLAGLLEDSAYRPATIKRALRVLSPEEIKVPL